MTEIIYISGPISSGPAGDDHSKAAFQAAVTDLKELGYEDHQIINPRGEEKGTRSSTEMLHIALAKLIECDKAVFLDNWEYSYGACLEMTIALCLGMPIFHIVSHKPWSISEMDRKPSLALAVERLSKLPDDRIRSEDYI